MQLISKKRVCELTSFSRAHIDRLSNDPDYRHHEFPRPVRLGQARVAYVLEEVLAWNATRVAERDRSEK